ncbi:hypothetical protein LPJ61_005887, partial [Coemansia biformis]
MSADVGWGETWYYLLVGFGAAVGTYRVLTHVSEQAAQEAAHSQLAEAKRTRRNAWYGAPASTRRTAAAGGLDTQRIDALVHLALSADYRQRKAASEVLLDLAMRPNMLSLVLQTAGDASSPAMRLRAVTLLQALAPATARQRRLVRAGALRVLVGCMRSDDKGLVLRASTTLVEFVGHQDQEIASRYRRRAARCGLLEVV